MEGFKQYALDIHPYYYIALYHDAAKRARQDNEVSLKSFKPNTYYERNDLEMAKYPLTELGHVAKDYVAHHVMSYLELGEAITKATGVEVKEASFQAARRDERGYEPLRALVMNYMREQDPELVESSLKVYDELYKRKGD